MAVGCHGKTRVWPRARNVFHVFTCVTCATCTIDIWTDAPIRTERCIKIWKQSVKQFLSCEGSYKRTVTVLYIYMYIYRLIFFGLFWTNVESKRTTRAEPEDHLWSADHSLRNAGIDNRHMMVSTLSALRHGRWLVRRVVERVVTGAVHTCRQMGVLLHILT
jgi:predicted small secreted protein